MTKVKKAEIILEYQNYIPGPPVAGGAQAMYKQAASNDTATIDAWRTVWLSNIAKNKAKFGSFADYSVGKLFLKHNLKPAIIAGAGPSLKKNVTELKGRGDVPLVSCLHNFHFLEDNGVPADYYLSLDAGPVVLEEVSEGGKLTEEAYWDLTKDRVLVAYIGSDPRLFERWQGQIYLFNAPMPEQSLNEEIDAIEPFRAVLSNGGNVLGSCLYFSKGVLGCPITVFVGADFSFAYDCKTFHSWASKYDAHLGQTVQLTDIFGIKVHAWPSYANFKVWFEWVSCNVPGYYINATEGGCLGSYPQGNIQQIKQMDLGDALALFGMPEHLRNQMENPATGEKKILF